MDELKRIPYGLTDFLRIQTENYYYVDKTHLIPAIEQAPGYQFLIRPRRFGKTLLLAILEDYYDLSKKDQFETLFGSTWIGENPTKLKNSYLVLSFNFSLVNPKESEMESSFESHCDLRFSEFEAKYSFLLDEEYHKKMAKRAKSYEKLECLYMECKRLGLKVFLIIDEYDNFANTVLSSENGKERYQRLTHDEGFFRFFFNKLKGGTSGSGAAISRLFITGVSPITMDDVTSGFNIGTNISTDNIFNELVGFTNKEVIELLDYYKSKGALDFDTEELMQVMQTWYNNYVFSIGENKPMFNSDMVLYFVEKLVRTKKYPLYLIDENVRIDYSKLRHLIILDKKLNGNFSILQQIIEEGEIVSNLIPGFAIKDLNKKECFVSLLYYFGLLTIAGEKEGKLLFEIPNLTIHEFYGNYFRKSYEESEVFKLDVFDFSNLIHEMAYRGEWQPVFEFLATEIKAQSKIRDYIKGEQMVKGFLLAYLNITNHYIIHSEMEFNKGYADLYLEPFFVKHKEIPYSYLIEIKYERHNEKGISAANEKRLVNEAKKQIKQYENDELIDNTKGNTSLVKLVLIWNGWELSKILKI